MCSLTVGAWPTIAPGLWFYAAPDTRLKELIMTDQHSMQPGCLDGAMPSHQGVEQ